MLFLRHILTQHHHCYHYLFSCATCKPWTASQRRTTAPSSSPSPSTSCPTSCRPPLKDSRLQCRWSASRIKQIYRTTNRIIKRLAGPHPPKNELTIISRCRPTINILKIFWEYFPLQAEQPGWSEVCPEHEARPHHQEWGRRISTTTKTSFWYPAHHLIGFKAEFGEDFPRLARRNISPLKC